MKLRSALVLAAAVPALWLSSSCGHKDDNAKPQIVGEWHGTKVVILSYENNQLQGSDTEVISSPDFIIFKFNDDKTLSESISVGGDNEEDQGYYTVVGNKIQISDSQTASIVLSYQYKITGNQMELIFVETETQNNTQMTVEDHIYLTKQ